MNNKINMTPNKPYLIRAFFDWIVENNCTPHILVATDLNHVIVPTQFISDNKIALNISPNAVAYLQIGNDLLTFNARFGGIATDISIPIGAIIAIYAMENGEGSGFELYETELDRDAIKVVDSKGSNKKVHLSLLDSSDIRKVEDQKDALISEPKDANEGTSLIENGGSDVVKKKRAPKKVTVTTETDTLKSAKKTKPTTTLKVIK